MQIVFSLLIYSNYSLSDIDKSAFLLITDASTVRAGAILSHVIDGQKKPIAYMLLGNLKIKTASLIKKPQPLYGKSYCLYGFRVLRTVTIN